MEEYEWSPLRVYIVWHPDFRNSEDGSSGEEIGKALYHWFGGENLELHRNGLGVPVHFVTSSNPEETPTDIPLRDNERTLIIPLIDAQLVGRQKWRTWIQDLESFCAKHSNSKKVRIFSWAVHSGAVHIGRIGHTQLLGTGPCNISEFLRKVTEVCSTFVLEKERLSVFISYARSDGKKEADQIRQQIQTYGHIDTFLDEHDIHPGEQWQDRIKCAIEDGSAMLAVVSDKYSSRPWCREELRTFREPRESGCDTPHWWLPPVFIVDKIENSSRTMFEAGNVSSCRWSPEKASTIIDQMIREILFGQVQRLRGEELIESGKIAKRSSVINWIPDTWTLLCVLRLKADEEVSTIIYPGDGLPSFERVHLQNVFTGVKLVSFEEIRSPAVALNENQENGLVYFSFSSPPKDDFIAKSMSFEHLEDWVLRIGRAVIRLGFDIGFGGSLKENFTTSLQTDIGTISLRPRVVNVISWPYSEKLSPNQIAENFGVCRFAKVGKAPATEKWLTGNEEIDASTFARKCFFGESQFDLDRKRLPCSKALLVFGGKIDNYGGIIPGIFEEVLEAYRTGKALFIFGGFGGAAFELTSLLTGEKDWSDIMERASPKWDHPELFAKREAKFRELISVLKKIRDERSLFNGLTWDENIDLFETLDATRASALVGKGLSTIVSKIC